MTKLSLLIYVFVILLLSYNASAKDHMRIVGGQEAPPIFGLFHASLQSISGSHVCGGAVVSKRHVVTAAHCVNGTKPEFVKVVVGTTNLSNNEGMKHDVATIHICSKFNFSARVNDIALLKANGGSKDQMQVLMLPVFSQEICRYAMRYRRKVTGEMFCTFTQVGQGTCHGDSGSPIIKDNRLVGIVSWGIPCAVGFPDVHTRVAPYIHWIQTKISNDICKSYKREV